ncbi:hypothetical protein [Natronorubrum daqingense]|uniref:Uncharacterized protein n=1 Tax=Natronorubrum daqingense TaxID=588898 RepID=A0A1N7F6J2_9EURY|nr:hypothetical protein [Natronorubrum daqingense]APX97570.1 hypothetical protein BB347_13665 [Natronorubrum daqingense]SIR95943.1 hypothetical protein SAMN05421809_3051 [Natronorubrum daqingense]
MSQARENHKVVNLYREQTIAYQNAREAVKRELGSDVSEGEIIKELARAYTGHNGFAEPRAMCGLVTETAAENGEMTYSYDELQQIENHKLRNMAADADTDAIHGKSTRLEIVAYFCCPEAI